MVYARQAHAWVVVPRPNPNARLRLFCFPYAGGGATLFRTWPAALPADVEVCAVQLPGREDRFGEPPISHLPSLIERLAAALAPYGDLPFAFYGHSMGTLISFELARYLQRHHQALPRQLLVSGHRAPQLPDRQPNVSNLPDDQFLARIADLNGSPSEILTNADLVTLFLPLLRADFTLVESYAYQEDAPLPCPISAYGGMFDREVNKDEIMAWEKQTTSHFKGRMLPADHFSMFRDKDLVLKHIASDVQNLLAAW